MAKRHTNVTHTPTDINGTINLVSIKDTFELHILKYV